MAKLDGREVRIILLVFLVMTLIFARFLWIAQELHTFVLLPSVDGTRSTSNIFANNKNVAAGSPHCSTFLEELHHLSSRFFQQVWRNLGVTLVKAHACGCFVTPLRYLTSSLLSAAEALVLNFSAPHHSRTCPPRLGPVSGTAIDPPALSFFRISPWTKHLPPISQHLQTLLHAGKKPARSSAL